MGTTTANAQENPEIGYIGPSYDGLRVFDSKDVSKSGYMDEEGNIIVPWEYSYYQLFQSLSPHLHISLFYQH